MIADRWGVTNDEVARRYACDEFVRSPVFEAWRGVTVHASADRVWPWVTQIRLAPYSYDIVDNLGRRSPRELRDLPDPVAGDRFTTAFAHRRLGRVLSVSPPRQLTGRISGVTITYELVPSDNSTRLLMKLTAPEGRWLAPFLSVGDLVMARRQLLNLKRLAERAQAR